MDVCIFCFPHKIKVFVLVSGGQRGPRDTNVLAYLIQKSLDTTENN